MRKVTQILDLKAHNVCPLSVFYISIRYMFVNHKVLHIMNIIENIYGLYKYIKSVQKQQKTE